MKKAFDANVSRAKPRLRLGAMLTDSSTEVAELGHHDSVAVAVEAIAAAVASEPMPASAPVIPSLTDAVRARAVAAREPKVTAVEALQQALAEPAVVQAPVAAAASVVVPVAAPVAAPVAVKADLNGKNGAAPMGNATNGAFATGTERPMVRTVVKAHAEPPAPVVEVQTAPAPRHDEYDAGERRERLKERLKAVRENPRPEPLPETVAEAGVLAVERISALQTEVLKVRTINLALSQDLEGARRQAERATEEARLRMDEARRLSAEMEGRAKLLSELEKELGALEGERDESLMALQESRQALDAAERDKDGLKSEIIKREQALAESLSEEERLAAELEEAHEASTNLRRSADALRQERDTLARQVSDLTKERAELLEARKALEAVHRALSTAAAR